MGPPLASTVLTAEQEAMAVALRRRPLLPLHDCRYARAASHAAAPVSALLRCFQRHGTRRLPPRQEGQKPPKKKCKEYPFGYLHVAFAEAQTEEGRQYLFVAVDRTSEGYSPKCLRRPSESARPNF